MCNRLTWTETAHCRSRVHCNLCRDREGGRLWRKKLSEHFRVPNDEVDWVCPYRQTWNSDRGLGDTVERVLTATGVGPVVKKVIERVTGRPCGCGKRRDAFNRAVPYKGRKDG